MLRASHILEAEGAILRLLCGRPLGLKTLLS